MNLDKILTDIHTAKTGVSVREALEARRNGKGKLLEDARNELSNNRSQQRNELVSDVLQSATLTTQENMLAEIKSGKSIDEVLEKYGVKLP